MSADVGNRLLEMVIEYLGKNDFFKCFPDYMYVCKNFNAILYSINYVMWMSSKGNKRVQEMLSSLNMPSLVLSMKNLSFGRGLVKMSAS